MPDNENKQNILAALEKVEHPAIAATLLDLGMIRDIEIDQDGKISLVLVFPFPNIPDNIRNYIVNSLAAAANSAGGELQKAGLALMTEGEVQDFLAKENTNWRG